MADAIVSTPVNVIGNVPFVGMSIRTEAEEGVSVHKPGHGTRSLLARAYERLWTWPAGVCCAFIMAGVRVHEAFRSRMRRADPKAKGGMSGQYHPYRAEAKTGSFK